MSNGTEYSDEDWFDTVDEKKKQPRRDAADAFLQECTKNPDDPASLRRRVLADPEVARAEFSAFYKRITGIDIPKDVQVICVDPDLRNRSKLVVLLLPTVKGQEGGAETVEANWGDGWLAAWQPY